MKKQRKSCVQKEKQQRRESRKETFKWPCGMFEKTGKDFENIFGVIWERIMFPKKPKTPRKERSLRYHLCYCELKKGISWKWEHKRTRRKGAIVWQTVGDVSLQLTSEGLGLCQGSCSMSSFLLMHTVLDHRGRHKELLSPMWETWMKFPAPGFSRTQSRLVWICEEWTVRWKTSLNLTAYLSLSFLSR